MADDKTVAVYDPEKLMDSVKMKIRTEFVSLIPEAAWTALVKKSVDSFFERKRGYHGEEPSEFDKLVNNMIHEEARKKIGVILNGPEWTVRWEDGGKMVSSAMEKLIKENVGEIMVRLLGQSMQGVISAMQNQIRI